MAKRFTDTNKYKKPFIRSLSGPYKLLWDFLYHDCDHAGIWIVDFETAQLYIGKDMEVTKNYALELFNQDETRIIEIDNGKKWFIPSFITFQYSQLSEKNRAHISVITALKKYGLLDSDLNPVFKNKPLTSPLQGAKDKEKDMDMEQDKEMEQEQPADFDDWQRWGESIVDQNDPGWDGMMGRVVSRAEMDEFLSVATRCEWTMKSQHAFRTTLKGFKSTAKPITNGNKIANNTASLVAAHQARWGK